jgi:hypothetical protein
MSSTIQSYSQRGCFLFAVGHSICQGSPFSCCVSMFQYQLICSPSHPQHTSTRQEWNSPLLSELDYCSILCNFLRPTHSSVVSFFKTFLKITHFEYAISCQTLTDKLFQPLPFVLKLILALSSLILLFCLQRFF